MFFRRLLPTVFALSCAAIVAGCQSDGPAGARSMKPIPADTVALMEKKGMKPSDPIVVRIFKEDSLLEVWKRRNDGQFALLKSYKICAWNGKLGPKVKEGDKQSPEGFYTITPGQMNPNSNYHLAFNIGFPNAYDRAYGRTGLHLMVHGACSSAGCYAMTDDQIAEIYAIGRESFRGGQRSFQVQAYPFRMTARNMARYRDNENIAFWKNLKEGYDHFEVSHKEPQVAVCGKRYVFNATGKDGAPLDPIAACPALEVNPQLAAAVTAKEKQDDEETRNLIAQGITAAPPEVRQNRTMIADKNALPVDPAQDEGSDAQVATAEAPKTPAPAGAAAPAAAKSSAFSWLTKPGANSPEKTPDEPAEATKPGVAAVPAPVSKPVKTEPAIAKAVEPKEPEAAPAATSSIPNTPFYRRWFGQGKTAPEADPETTSSASKPSAAVVPAPKPDPKS